MKNFEKRIDYIVREGCTYFYNLKNGTSCLSTQCSGCEESLKKWLLEECKEPPKLTKNERSILESVDCKWVWIARDKTNNIVMFTDKPYKEDIWWDCEDFSCSLPMYNHLFQFIKWEDEDPYNIECLLN